MFYPRLTACRILSALAALLITTVWAAIGNAQSAAASGDQWRAAGSSSPSFTQSSSVSGSNQSWRLPNSKPNSDDTQLVDEDSNPLRPSIGPQAPVKVSEPRSFQPPTNAAPLSAAKSAATSGSPQSTNQPRSNSSAAVTRPGTIKTQAYMAQQPQMNRAPSNAQRPFVQPNYRPVANSGNRSNAPNDNVWDAINVAFNGPAAQQQSPAQTSKIVKPQGTQMKRQSENLPLPGEGDYELNDPVMRFPGGPGEFADRLGGPCYRPYCEQGNCASGPCSMGCSGPCCGDSCDVGCGCPCGEPGCGCEPGCDCPSGNCKKEVFCIGPGDDESCHIVQVRWPKWQEVIAFGGVQGFKGPYDRDRDSGNFGFNEGFNIGAKVPYCALGYQFGYRAAQSQLNGDIDTGIDKSFNQSFVTAGLFHRQAQGLNFGVVWDGLVDERSPSNNFHQIRSELSVIGCACHEFGFGATVGLNSHGIDDGEGGLLNYQASDQYVLFYRLHGCAGGEGRIFAGVNNDSDGILGADSLIPIGGCFSFQSGFTYLIPNETSGTAGASHEAWNIGLGLVWHWDGQARKCFDNCYRPLFNVADNGILIVDQQDRNN